MANGPFYRGSTVFFTATFTDHTGAALTPDSATLYITYTSIVGVRTSVIIPMTDGEAEWDSAVAMRVTSSTPLADRNVEWSIRTADDENIAIDGEFFLAANEANPDS